TLLAPACGILSHFRAYRLTAPELLVAPTGATRTRVVDALPRRSNGLSASITDHTLSRGLIAIQGPASAEIVQRLVDLDLPELRYYRCATATLTIGDAQVPALLARTGYTGEDGFEISISANDAEAVWE